MAQIAPLGVGMIDKDERQRLDAAVQASGLARDGAAWLEEEIADPADLDTIAARINERPRKVLDWASSHDAYADSLNTISGALTG